MYSVGNIGTVYSRHGRDQDSARHTLLRYRLVHWNRRYPFSFLVAGLFVGLGEQAPGGGAAGGPQHARIQCLRSQRLRYVTVLYR